MNLPTLGMASESDRLLCTHLLEGVRDLDDGAKRRLVAKDGPIVCNNRGPTCGQLLARRKKICNPFRPLGI